MDRLPALALTGLLLVTAGFALVPTAEAAPPCWYEADKVDCVRDRVCIWGYAQHCLIKPFCGPEHCYPVP